MTDDIPSVFLSYPSQCKGTVQTFADSLRKEKVVVAMAGDLDLLPGLPWTHWIENQLRAARACLVWVEDTGLTPYQERELEYALSLHDHSKKISGTSNVGTYAVIPLIAKRNHEKFRWDIRLHSFQFIDPEDQASVPLIVEAVKVRLHGAVGGRGNDASSLERLFGENPSALGTCPWAPLPPTPHAESQNSVIMSVIPITNEQFGRFERRPTPRSDCRLLPPIARRSTSPGSKRSDSALGLRRSSGGPPGRARPPWRNGGQRSLALNCPVGSRERPPFQSRKLRLDRTALASSARMAASGSGANETEEATIRRSKRLPFGRHRVSRFGTFIRLGATTIVGSAWFFQGCASATIRSVESVS